MRQPIDNAWQQQLQAFEVSPHPTDWEAIYLRLHGDKKRRTLWWIPLLLLVLSGAGIWYMMQPAGTMALAVSASTITPYPDNAAAPESPSPSSAVDALPPTTKPDDRITTEAIAGLGTAKAEQKTTMQDGPKPAKNNRQQSAAAIAVPTAAGTDKATGAQAIPPVKPSAEQATMAGVPRPAASETPLTSSPNLPAADADYEEPIATQAMVQRISMHANPLTAASFIWPFDSSLQKTTMALAVATTPSARKLRPALQLWPWLSAGITSPGEAAFLSLNKAAEINNDLNSGNPGSIRTVYSSTGLRSGANWSAGLMLHKPIGHRLQLRIGAGIMLSQWSDAGSIFRDSTLPGGSQTNRQSVGSYHFDYNHLAVQVPLLVSGRVGPLRPTGFGWTIGVVNNFTLSLREQRRAPTSFATGAINNLPFTQDNLVAPSARIWQPAAAAGVYLRHQKKSEWQLEPRAHLPLESMYQNTGSAEQLYPASFSLHMLWRLK